MKQKKSMIVMSIVALVLSSFMIAGNAGAMYMGDGATQNGATGGWNAPTDGICVLGLHPDGTMDVDTSIKTARDCQARLIDVTAGTAGDTLANVCANPLKNAAGVKYAAPGSSTCVTTTGGFITGSLSMANLDRNAQMCNANGGVLANAAGVATTANGTAAKCIAYGWQYRYQDASGTPLPFGSSGVTPAASGTGFCYTSVRTGIAAASCPSTLVGADINTLNAKNGYSVNGSNCLYAYGTSGVANAALTNINGTSYAAAGATVDLRNLTQGQCLANGATWANGWGFVTSGSTYGTANGWTSGTGVAFDQSRQALNSDDGCLHCHSYKSQQNGPSERFKDSYIMTGHKNMLRKVIAGMNWAGPDGVVYTQDTLGHAIDFITAGGSTTSGGLTPATVGGGPLFYVFGDWMALYPDAVGPTGDTALYSCAGCHTTGYNDSTNPGVQSIGIPGYAGTKPGDYGGGYVTYVTAGNKWDREGINCSRCHNATVPAVTAAQIASSAFTHTAPTSSGMGALASGTGRNNLCFGCHQSIAKNWPAQGGASGGTAQYDPTIIPTGVNHGASAGRDFNGHVLGNSFLNSVHARYAGTQTGNGSISLNSLGKYDLTDPAGTTEYASLFKGYTCWQSPTSNSPAKTNADGTEITNKAQCESLYGTGSWRADQDGSLAATSVQGTCTTCHDVHNSLFVADQSEKAIRKDCATCHVNNASISATDVKAPQVASFNHPQTPGTPFDTTIFGNDSCSVCHMATQAVKNGNQNTMPAHVWRINTDPNYNTFPTADQFNGTNGATKDRNAQVAPEQYLDANGNVQTYAKAVWVDIDMACGQCHGGSLGASAVVNGAPYKSKTELAGYAANMHNEDPVPNFTWVQTSGTKNANFDASLSVCPVGATCSYSWDFGDGSNGTGQTISHSYSTAVPGVNTYSATLTVSSGINSTPLTHNVTVNLAPTVAETSFGATNVSPYMTVNLQDSSTAGSAITVNWGDGSLVSNGSAGGLFTHTYTKINTYTVVHAASVGGIIASENLSITVPVKSPVSGNVTSKAGVPLQSVSLTLKLNGVTKGITSTDASGNFTFINITPGTYTVTAAKAGYTFASPAATLTVATGAVTGVNFSSSN